MHICSQEKWKECLLQFLVHIFSKSIFYERAHLSGLHGYLLQIHIYYVLATCNKMTDCHNLRANQALISSVKSAGIWLNSFFSPTLYLTVNRVCLNYKNCFFTNGIYPTQNINKGCHGQQGMTNSLTCTNGIM